MNEKNCLTPQKQLAAKQRLVRMHFESGVGHLGGNLSCLDAMVLVFHEFLNHGDKFILSKGHSAGALYVSLWSVGYLSDNDLTSFHKDNTVLAGHPPANSIAQIPFATGSLGHGLSLASGVALAFKINKNQSNVICMTSDGEWQEGSTWEALIFAIHNKLINLTILVDHNNLQGFGSTYDVASMSPLQEKLKGFDIDVLTVDGHDLNAIRSVLEKKVERIKVIILETIKGCGVSFMENKMEWHYLPLTQQQYEMALNELKVGYQ